MQDRADGPPGVSVVIPVYRSRDCLRELHERLVALGPEPLSELFSADYLFRVSRGRKIAVKPFIMDAKVVVGVGNIYASEALYMAGIHPKRLAGRISRQKYALLCEVVREVLQDAIAAGGTTLRDFQQEDGRPGYFAQQLQVYGRTESPCPVCGEPIRSRVIGQRSSYFCHHCQH